MFLYQKCMIFLDKDFQLPLKDPLRTSDFALRLTKGSLLELREQLKRAKESNKDEQ